MPTGREETGVHGSAAHVREVVRAVWGFDRLRPLQEEAIRASLARRDSLVVMPTGGGKSLCYQVPPLITGRLCVVVSPLIALMNDQVAGLTLAGYPAAALHGHVSEDDSARIRRSAESGELRLLLVAPERLLNSSFITWLKRLETRGAGAGVESFAIDEAHCISQWGHDFRPEYRRLAELRRHFPGAPLHAYTATATERVREDIIVQLGLRDPAVLVGRFDRPNLTYRVAPRVRLEDQAIEALRRHDGEAAIVYCISRKDTESMAEALRGAGVDARAYHAGMDGAARQKTQERFKNERLNVVVATVAFGMGIDRGDVRLVLHAAMPKTIEHYQQETGRAGRDGLPAECVLLYSAHDTVRWRQLMERAAAESDSPDEASEALAAQQALLAEMQRFCAGARCRHRALSEYFGQAYEPPSGEISGCGACDVCLKELDEVEGATVIAQKILSCVARVGQAFGSAHVISVLRGSASAKVRERGHDQLSTFGLLRDEPKDVLAGYIGQLVDQGLLAVEPGQYPILRLTPDSRAVLRSERPAVLVRARSVDAHRERARGRGADTGRALTDAERRVFDALRAERRTIAEEMGAPPYVVCSDDTLEEMARVRPSDQSRMLNIRGIGQKKLETFGDRLLAALKSAAREAGLELDAAVGSRPRSEIRKPTPCPADMATLFGRGASVEEVCAATGRAPSTVHGHLVTFIADGRAATIDPWVDPQTRERVERALSEVGGPFLRPVYDHLEQKIPYEPIRIVAAFRGVLAPWSA